MIKYPLATTSWDNREIEAIYDVIESGVYTMGPKVQQFETDFAKFVGSKYAVMVNSGSSANLLAVAALFYDSQNPIHRGDEVIVPAVSWSTTYYPLYQYGLKIKFVDIDIDTLNYDLDALEDAVTSNTKVIMAVNLLGNPNQFQRITDIIAGREILLLEDNCESLGAVYAGKQAGTFGVMGTYSSFFSHHISTMEGGLIVTDNEEYYHILLALRAHGWTRNLPVRNSVTGIKSSDQFDESFNFVLPGYNVRPLEMSGAIGIEQLQKLPSFLEARRQNAKVFQKLMENVPQFQTQTEIGSSSWFGFSLVIRPGTLIIRKDLISKLMEGGIECRPIVAGNFAKNPVVKWFNYEVHKELVNAEYIDEHGFFVGNHHYDITEMLEILVEVLSNF